MATRDVPMKDFQEYPADGSGPPEIRPEEIVLEELIGSGSFGKVYKGRCRQKAVAVKILHKQQFDSQTLAVFRKEVYLMKIEIFRLKATIVCSRISPCWACVLCPQLDNSPISPIDVHLSLDFLNPHHTYFMGAVTIPGKLMIVTELVAKGNLETLLHDEKINLPLPLRMRMARDAALGVLWLHESTPTFIHRDLKTSNLLVDENMRVKICDFGLSTVKPQRHQMLKDQTTAKGTPLFMAPEVMMFKEFNESSDVYSFAIVLWEILSRQEPFSQFRALDEFRQAVCVRHERPPVPVDTIESLRRLIERCWDKEPSRRPSFREIVVALEHIIVEAAISNQRGREFWKRYFLNESLVAWDTFIDAFCDWLKVPNRAACEKGSVPYLNIKCLKAVLAETPNSDGSTGVLPEHVVNMEKFGKILEYFGPLQDGFMDGIRELLAQKWFHGELDTADAAARLNQQPPGSFLVRFSSTNPGCFTTSQVIADGSIRHQRVQHQPGKGFLFQNVLYPRLAELVASTFNPALACINYKFLSIFYNASGAAHPSDTRYG